MRGTREPTTVIGLVHSIVDNAGRTWHAVCLLLAGSIAVAVVLLPVLIVAALFGTPGVAAIGGVGTAAIGALSWNRRRRRESGR